MKYFLKTFFIYLLLISGFLFINLDKNISDLSGQESISTVEFVYEAF
jgi:lipopolysaccharide export LptBFGC system permease protein LptF